MKIKNIIVLIIMLIGFVACTSESELLDAPVNGDLVSITINLGSLQTKASVGLDTGEGAIYNAVIGIFDTKGLPTIAPVVLNGESGNMRIPLKPSNAYAFVNVSEDDIAALQAIGNEEAFKNYAIIKELTQKAGQLPKFGSKMNFAPKENEDIKIEVHQLTARVEAMVNIKVYDDGKEITNPGLSFSTKSLLWTNMALKSANNETSGIDGTFETTIGNVTYGNIFNRAYTYPQAKPSVNFSGSINGSVEGFAEKQISLSYTFSESLLADNVYLLRFTVKVDITQPANPTFTYEVIPMPQVPIDVPGFN